MTTAELVAALRQLQLLQPAQLDDVARKIESKKLDARTLAQELIEHGWLSPYQVNQLLQGRGKDLVLGKYVLLERLGEGGMGEVFKARHQKMGRIVAIKLIRKERLANKAAVERFHREIRSASQLSHPNVVHAFDADQVGGTHLFAMEYVEGVDLNKLVREKGPLPVEQASDCIRQAALGLQHAFEKGMVHRDIKPHNLLLAKAQGPLSVGLVKILDFGLARMATDDSSTLSLTKEGSVLGTVDYVAPEQARDSHAVDIRSDLYSLGCTFYFLLAGQVPFPGGEALEKLYKHGFEEAKPVEQVRRDVPAGVAGVIRKLMAKRPEDRFQTPAELAAVLANGGAIPAGAAQRLPSPGARQTASAAISPDGKQSGRRRLLVASAALAGLLILLLGIYLAQRTAGEPKPGDTIINSIGMRLAYVPPGRFMMGSTPQEIERFKKEPHHSEPGVSVQSEGPQHEVRITRGFYMGVYEVKQGEYERVIGKNPSAFKGGPDYPVEGVNWDEAVEFYRKLSELPEEKKAGRRYRLPTEAEWEYACRAGKQTIFHWGDSLSSKEANFNAAAPFGGAEKGPSIGKTARCGSYPPNAWGLYDMHGNVSEWTLDALRTYTSDAVDDPRGPEAAGSPRVMRGGSWLHDAWNCRSAQRQEFRSSHRYNNLGFRVVCELPREPSSSKSKMHAGLGYNLKSHPSEAVEFKGHWYAYYPEKFTWQEAKKRCQEMGGYLACIRTPEEQEFALKLTNRGNAWLGGFNDSKRTWFWITGESITDFYWAPTQPDNAPPAFLQMMPKYPTSVGIQCWGDIGSEEMSRYLAGVLCEWDF